MKILIGSDHHGIDARQNLVRLVASLGYEAVDVGPQSSQTPTDYPNIAAEVARAVSTDKNVRGILICGTGVGMSIAANKFPGVRAAPISDVFSGELSRRHNDLNVLCLSAEMLAETTMNEIVVSWLRAEFSGDGSRHERRLNKIAQIEKDQIARNLATE